MKMANYTPPTPPAHPPPQEERTVHRDSLVDSRYELYIYWEAIIEHDTCLYLNTFLPPVGCY